MKSPAVILLIFSVALASAAETLVSLDFHNNRLAPGTEVEITVDSEGVLMLKSESKMMNRLPRQRQLPLKTFQDLKRELEEVDWETVSADKIEGRDGTSVRISSGKNSASLWSPDHDSKRRGLSRIQKVIETLMDLSGLDGSGIPKRDKVPEQGVAGDGGKPSN